MPPGLEASHKVVADCERERDSGSDRERERERERDRETERLVGQSLGLACRLCGF